MFPSRRLKCFNPGSEAFLDHELDQVAHVAIKVLSAELVGRACLLAGKQRL